MRISLFKRLALALLLLDVAATHRRQKETVVLPQKQMFKVLCPMKRGDGGTFWMRLGTGFRNRDNSINIILDSIPAPTGTEWKFQLREYEEEDLRKSEARRNGDSYSSREPGGLPRSESGFAARAEASSRAAAPPAADGVPF